MLLYLGLLFIASYTTTQDVGPETSGAAEERCGGDLFMEEGKLNLDYYYTQYYPKVRECEWSIINPDGIPIKLTFDSFELKADAGCRYSYLEIRDGLNNRTPLLKNLCGSSLPESIRSTGYVMYLYVKFAADTSVGKQGFSAKFEHALPTQCGGVLNMEKGTLSSPNYPQRYPNKMVCTWQIMVPYGNLVDLTIESFELESHRQCGHDYLEIRDGYDYFAPLLRRLCGTHFRRISIRSTSNVLYLKFKSDSHYAYNGFNATFSTDSSPTTSGSTGSVTAEPSSLYDTVT